MARVKVSVTFPEDSTMDPMVFAVDGPTLADAAAKAIAWLAKECGAGEPPVVVVPEAAAAKPATTCVLCEQTLGDDDAVAFYTDTFGGLAHPSCRDAWTPPANPSLPELPTDPEPEPAPKPELSGRARRAKR